MTEMAEEETEYTVLDDAAEGEMGEDEESHSITGEEESAEKNEEFNEEEMGELEEGGGGEGGEEEEEETEEGLAKDGEEDKKDEEPGQPLLRLALTFQEKGYRFKRDYIRDAVRNQRLKTMAVYPVKVEDLSAPSMKSCLEKCISYNWNVSTVSQSESSPLEGLLDMQFRTVEDADEAEKVLPEIKENLKIHRLAGDVSEYVDDAYHTHHSEEMAAKLIENYKEPDLPAKRMLVITNLPESITERKLLEIFPKAYVGIAVGESKQRLGHAIVQFETREQMLAELDENNGTELGDATLNMVDMMMTGVEPLENKAVFGKVKELVDLRLELAKSWHIHYSRERKSIIRKIYSREAQLELDELVKGETDSESSVWRTEMMKRLQQRKDDLRIEKTGLLTMCVEDLYKEYEKDAGSEPDTVRGGEAKERSSSGLTERRRGSWTPRGGGGRDYGDKRRSWSSSESRPPRGGYRGYSNRGNFSNRGGYSSRGGYRESSYKKKPSGPYDREPREKSYQRGRGSFRSEFSGRGRGSYAQQNQALDLLAGLSEILGARDSGNYSRDRGYSRRGRGGYSRGGNRYHSSYEDGEGTYSGGGYSYKRY